MAADNLRIQFVFAKGCPGCDRFKASNPATGKSSYETLKDGLEDKGHSVRDMTVASVRPSDAPASPNFLKRCTKWYPLSVLIPQKLYEKADQFPVNDIMSSVALFNGNIVRNGSGELVGQLQDGERIPRDFPRSDVANYTRFIERYLKSPQYAKARELLASLNVTSAGGSSSSGPAPQPAFVPSAAPKPAPIMSTPTRSSDVSVESLRRDLGDLVIVDSKPPASKTSTKSEFCASTIGFKPRPRYH